MDIEEPQEELSSQKEDSSIVDGNFDVSICDDNLSITYEELIHFIIKSGLSLSDPKQKEVMFNYICQKLDISINELLEEDTKNLKQSIAKFHNTLKTKYQSPKG